MNHQFSIDDEIHAWAQESAGTGKRPDRWLRTFLRTCMANGMTVARAADLPKGPSGYVGDVRVIKLRREGESRCNRCADMLRTTDLVIEQHYIRANGTRETHYLHGWGCLPSAQTEGR